MPKPKGKRLLVVISFFVGLAILIGIGPIIIAWIMKGVNSHQVPPVALKNEPTNPETEAPQPETVLSQPEDPQPEKSEVMLMVTGEVAVVKDGNLSWIILTASSGRKYILVGPKAEELKDIAGRAVTVTGIPSKPIPKEIKGQPIRMTIEVKTTEIK